MRGDLQGQAERQERDVQGDGQAGIQTGRETGEEILAKRGTNTKRQRDKQQVEGQAKVKARTHSGGDTHGQRARSPRK